MHRIALVLTLVACRPHEPASQALSHVAAGPPARPVPVLTDLDEPSSLAIGAGGVYVAAKGKLVRAGDHRELPVEAGGALTDLVVAGSTAYAVDTYRLIAIPLDGGAPRDLLEVKAFEATMAGDRVGLVWGTSVPHDEAGKLFAAAHGGAPATLADSIAHVRRIVVDGDRAYWVSRDGAFAIARTGGPITRLLPRPEHAAHDIAVHGGGVYVALEDGIVAVPAQGGEARRLVTTTGDDVPTSLAVDDIDVYYVDAGATTSVRRVPRGGGASVKLADDTGTIVALAVDRDAVYWLTGHELVRLAK